MTLEAIVCKLGYLLSWEGITNEQVRVPRMRIAEMLPQLCISKSVTTSQRRSSR